MPRLEMMLPVLLILPLPDFNAGTDILLYVISDHANLFGVKACWNFFESGHGKGPCDGLGGVAKRMADLASRHSRTIQDAEDFFKWGKETSKAVHYIFVSEEDVSREKQILETLTKDTVPCKGTIKAHCVYTVERNVIVTRTTSCCCHNCLTGDLSQCQWTQCTMWKKISKLSQSKHPSTAMDTQDHTPVPHCDSTVLSTSTVEEHRLKPKGLALPDSDILDVHPDKGDFVAAVYQKQWYVGKVKDIDEEEGECYIEFMEKSKKKKKRTPTSGHVTKVNCECPLMTSSALYKNQKQQVDLGGHFSFRKISI